MHLSLATLQRRLRRELPLGVMLLAPLGVPAQFRVLPYVQNPGSDAISVIWFSENDAPGTLEVPGVGSFGSTPELASALDYSQSEIGYIHGANNHGAIYADVAEGEAPAVPYRHGIRVSGLSPAQSYEYTVTQPGADEPFAATFETAPETGAATSLRFLIMADMETEPESTQKSVPWSASDAVNGGDKLDTDPDSYSRQYPIDQTEGYRQNLKFAAAREPDFWAIAGDLAEKGGRQLDWDEFWRHAAGEWGTLASGVPIFPALGNHENYWHPSEGGYSAAAVMRSYDKWASYWEVPANGASDSRHEKRYYRVDYGPVTLITLDSSNGDDSDPAKDTNLMIDGAASHSADFNPGSEQWNWAEAQLADAREQGQVIFVQWHHAAYGTGVHSLISGSAGIANQEDNQSGRPMRVYHPLMMEYGVAAVFSGHDELLEYVELDGVHYWDVGFAGDGLRGPGYPPTTEYLPFDLLPEEAQASHWSAHGDAPEVWRGKQLIDGGKHYGFLEVDVLPDPQDPGCYEIVMSPRYSFPLMDADGTLTGEYAFRTYDKVVRLKGRPAELSPEVDLLTDPFLQLPTDDSINVVWFTEFAGIGHHVEVGDDFSASFEATTTKLSRVAEDAASHVGTQSGDGSVYSVPTRRGIWRHEATVTSLTPGQRVPYRVVSKATPSTSVTSEAYSLAPLPPKGQPLKILMTSDHQLKNMTPANLQKVVETVGMVDAVFYAGDLQNIPDRASEWFDDNRGISYFASLQGRSRVFKSDHPFTGGAIIQHAPLFPVIGNHEVMGRYDPLESLGNQFNFPQPRWFAAERYEEVKQTVNPTGDPAIKEQWITDNSFNTITYEEIFSLPDSGPEGELYYAQEFGDVYLMGLYTTRIWRSPGLGANVRGKYRERETDFGDPAQWGFGDFLFWDFSEGSAQYEWFGDILQTDAYQDAKVRYLLTHQTSRGTGDNVNPLLAEPVQIIERANDGGIEFIRYEYPREADVFHRDLHPLIEEAEVDIVHFGHSHVWTRLITEGGVNYIETSNVGNNYGSYIEGYKTRGNVPNDPRFNAANYVATGDPWGAEPIMPSIQPVMTNPNTGDALPTIDSNTVTAFSILDTEKMTVSSYYFDTEEPDRAVVKFDEFPVENQSVEGFELETDSASVGQSGGSHSVTVQADPPGSGWTASSDVDWITIESDPRQYGDGEVRFTVTENPSTAPRGGTVIIAGQTFTVSQSGIDVAALIDDAVATATSGVTLPTVGALVREMETELVLPIETSPADLAWTASSEADWITIDPTSGTGEAELSLSIEPNPEPLARSAVVTVGGAEFFVAQAGTGELSGFFGGLTPIGAGWAAQSHWLGWIYLGNFPWVYLSEHGIGWAYCVRDLSGGLYYYQQSSGEWFYSDETLFPWAYGYRSGWVNYAGGAEQE